MIACDVDLLSQYLENALPLPRRREVEAHLKVCAPCERELDELRRIDSILLSWGSRQAPIPISAERRITGSIERRKRFAALFTVGKMMPAAVGSTIAALLVLVSVNTGMLVQNGQPSNFLPRPTVSAKNIAKQSAPLLAARRSSAILSGHPASRLVDPARHRTLLEVN